MAKKKKKLKKRNPEAKKLQEPLFRQRIVPKKKRARDIPSPIEEWND